MTGRDGAGIRPGRAGRSGDKPSAVSEAAESPSRQRRWALVTVLGVAAAWIVFLTLRHAVIGLATEYAGDLPPHPWLHLIRSPLLGLATPVAVIAVTIVLLAPGVLLVMATNGAKDAADLGLEGFALSYALRFASHAVLVRTGLWSAERFVLLDLGLCASAAMLLLVRARRGGLTANPLTRAVERHRLVTALALTGVLTAALAPIILWQDIGADGLEALTSGLSLDGNILPRFPTEAGVMGLGVGMGAMAYPTHWFTTLLGPIEAAARLPAMLYAPLLFLTLAALIEVGTPRRLRPVEQLAVFVLVGVFVTTLGLNGSYEPYAADMAAPAAFESLTVLAMSAAILYLWRGRPAWFVGFVLLAYFARPTGFLLLLLLALSTLTLEREERVVWLRRIGLGVVACFGLWLLYEKIFIAGVADDSVEYLTPTILQRFRYVRFLDLKRLLFVIVPSGGLPALALLAVRHQDRLARTLAVVCLAYFVFFYFQAFVALHHFAPLMLLPAVVFWRMVLNSRPKRWIAPAALAGLTIALLVAIPPEYAIYRAVRPIGRVTVFEAGNVLGNYAQYRESLEHNAILAAFFPSEVDEPEVDQRFVLAPDVIAYYSQRYHPDVSEANYVAQYDSTPDPAGLVKVAERDGMVAFVRDTVLWRVQQTHPPTDDFRSALYTIPRTTMHRFLGVPAGSYDVDLAGIRIIGRIFWMTW